MSPAAWALRESRIAFMNRSTFLWLMDHSIPFNRYLITQLNERLGQFIGMMENERMLDTDARIARCLAGLFNPVLYPGTNRLLQISQILNLFPLAFASRPFNRVHCLSTTDGRCVCR